MKRAFASGIVLLAAAALAGALLAPRMLLACWLAAWWWCLGLVLGSFTNAWIHGLTGGAWGGPARDSALAMRRCMPWLLAGALPMLLGAAQLYPWAADPQGWTRDFARPAFLQIWFTPLFFAVRMALYALAWWWLARPATLDSKQSAAVALLLHTVLTSLAAVDLLMSLLPGWFSTAFGLVALSAQALAGAAAAALQLAISGRPNSTSAGVPLSRDIGNLLLMWLMTWAYLAFMQFLIIWSENLPREIAWYVPRLQTGWAQLGVALVLLQLVVPFFALLSRRLKDEPRRLAWVASLALLASMLDAAWMVLPSVDPHSLDGWWLAPPIFAGAALLVAAAVLTPRSPARQRDERLRHV